MLVKERMSRNPITIKPDTPVTEAQAMMKRDKIHHLPVVDRDGRRIYQDGYIGKGVYMKTVYRGFAQRVVERIISSDNVPVDPSALIATIKRAETGAYLTATAEGEFSGLDVLANKIETGRYFVEVTPDVDETAGIYVCYLRATYDGETFELGPDVFEIRAEDEVPATANNYVSLDSISTYYPDLLDLYKNPTDLLRIGEKCSRILDSELDGRFVVPIRKRADTGTYDEILVKAATILTVARTLKANGFRDVGNEFEAEFRGYVEDINGGRFRLWEEITVAEIGFSAPRPATTNTGTGVELELDAGSLFSGMYHSLFIVQVDAEGDVYEDGAGATVKASIDGGKTWEVEGLPALPTWFYPSGCYGLGIRFFRRGASGTLKVGDKWEIEAWPLSTEPSRSMNTIRQGRVEL